MAFLALAAIAIAASPSARAAVQAHSAGPGLALAVTNARPLTVASGCGQVETGTSARLGVFAVYGVARRTRTVVRIGEDSWRLAPGRPFSAVIWLPLTAGRVRACANLADLKAFSLRLLAHSRAAGMAFPGGLVDLTARLPLASSGARSGGWPVSLPGPAEIAGVVVQVDASRAGVVAIGTGATAVRVAVGRADPAATLIVPLHRDRLSWTSSARWVRPQALLLGYVTLGNDSITGGSRIHPLSRQITLHGRRLLLAGLPALSSRSPATSVLASVEGPSLVKDPLADGHPTQVGSVARGPAISLFQLSRTSAVSFTAAVTLRVEAWLGGVIRSIKAGPVPPTPATYAETTGSVAHTWSDYTDAGGGESRDIEAHDTVQIACRLEGFTVADGNDWWYEIASPPWRDRFFASADAFYNNGATSGPLAGTPFVDPKVQLCDTAGYAETTGAQANAWSDYADAGGRAGDLIGASATIRVTCAVRGFLVADGNAWWYLIGSPPWKDEFYASADAFYNNGATSGRLAGTPFVDPAVPRCVVGSQ